MVNSSDGFTWTPSGGVRHGLPTIGVVVPASHSIQPPTETYDAIVIGSGYAGLVAARDLATQAGKKTLLIEARDRLGGRTWHSTINGFNYEMGGTWIHWHMPHIYREVSLYGLHNDWIVTQNPGGKEDYCTVTTGAKQRNISHADENEIAGRVFQVFCNVDGNDLRETWKYAFSTNQSPEPMAKWDALSCQDRLDEVRDQLTAEEVSVLEAQLLQMGGNSLDKMGLLEALRWWSLGSNVPSGLNNIALHTRLRSGNSVLHRRIFEHALSTGNLSYAFETPVQRIEDAGGVVTVTSRDGRQWKAKDVVCTVPLNVLSDLEFSPPLDADKLEAAAEGSVNKCNKVHVDFNGPDYLSWSSLGTPGKGLVAAFGDHLTPADNSHLVAFGPDPDSPRGISLDDTEALRTALVHLLPKDKQNSVIINRIVTHDWNSDEFAKGTWCYLPPAFTTKYLSALQRFTTKYLSALQRSHGNVYFASADFSDGWRGWIDGAVQAGMQTAYQIIQKQRKTVEVKEHKLTNGALTNGVVTSGV
ncbi:Monoamine oxidase N [Neonectria ditissima]|uniref:Amine oxidase n=1 Tax=Neonectria ditissima TaxID=78410 RepID=A0A0P7BN24_9HYPO|nr:Monoamine oxidase N [Neonectria ditissima]